MVGCETTIFVDECGYTGQDLLNDDQPILTLASVGYPEATCRGLMGRFFAGIQMPEPKYQTLARREGGQRRILALLRALAEDSGPIKLCVTHKRYAVIAKFVDLFIEPGLRDRGLDLYRRGEHHTLSDALHRALASVEGEAAANAFLARLQNLIRRPGHATYDALVDHLVHVDTLTPFGPLLPTIADDAAAMDKLAGIEDQFDLIVPSMVTLVVLWQRAGTEAIDLIHDTSKAMARQAALWDAFANPARPALAVAYDDWAFSLPAVTVRTRAGESRHWAGLQLADILAGTATRAVRWSFLARDPRDRFGHEVAEVLEDIIFDEAACVMVWPGAAMSPESRHGG